MSWLTKIEGYSNPGVGTFVIKTSRFNFIKHLLDRGVQIYFIPDLPGSKAYEIEDIETAVGVASANTALEAMAVLRKIKPS